MAEIGAATSRVGASPARFVVLLPMLREDRIVADTCRRLAASAVARPAVEFVVVTGDGEARDRDAAAARLRTGNGDGIDAADLALAVRPGGHGALRAAVTEGAARRAAILAEHCRPITAEVAAPVLAQLNGELGRDVFLLVTVVEQAGTKVEKLNAAVEQWRRDQHLDPAQTFVGVYDADSDPDPATLDLVAAELARRAAAGERPPSIFQQVSCYCRGLPDLVGARGLFGLADALAQTRWALGFEYPLYRRYASAVRRGATRPLAYCVGHGCFVALAHLDRIGGFPAWSATDDLALGYTATMLGAEIAPIPALDYCEVAPDPASSMRQARFWFSGSARFAHDVRYVEEQFGLDVPVRQRLRLLVDGHGRNVAWAGRGVGWVAALAAAVGTRRWRLAAALLAGHVCYAQGGYVQTVGALRALPGAAARTGLGEVPRRRLVVAGLAASPVFVLRSIGPFAGFVDGLLGRRGRGWKQER